MSRKDYTKLFYFTKRERRGILCLISIIFILQFCFPFLQDFTDLNTDIPAFEEEISQYKASLKTKTNYAEVPTFNVNTIDAKSLIEFGLKAQVAETWIKFRHAKGMLESIDDVKNIFGIDHDWIEVHQSKMLFKKAHLAVRKQKKELTPQRFNFDPNTASATTLRSLGFSKLAVASVLGFREKGGSFHKPEDLTYIFGIEDDFVEELSSFISIDTANKVSPTVSTKLATRTKPEHIVIDINGANVFQWQMLPGIGQTLANRIVKFRNRLGGFHSADQVAETYGLPDSTFISIRSHLHVSEVFRMLDVNTITADSLRRHPYFNWKQSSILINFRNQRGGLHALEELYEVKVFDSAFIHRVAPYMTFGSNDN